MRLSLDLTRVRALAAIVLAGGTLLLAPCVSARPPWLNDFNDEYGTDGTRLDSCGLCHLDFDNGALNPYAVAFDNAGGPSNPAVAFAAIESAFSDSDSTSNLDEIMALFMPGISCSNLGDTSNAPANLADYVDPVLPGCVADADGDGVSDSEDNCVNIANPDQRDSNGDGFGNLCDADLNGDCITNPIDLGLFRAVFFQSDDDADLNGDGIVNPIDLGIFRSLFFMAPGPSGLPNACP